MFDPFGVDDVIPCRGLTLMGNHPSTARGFLRFSSNTMASQLLNGLMAAGGRGLHNRDSVMKLERVPTRKILCKLSQK